MQKLKMKEDPGPTEAMKGNGVWAQLDQSGYRSSYTIKEREKKFTEEEKERAKQVQLTVPEQEMKAYLILKGSWGTQGQESEELHNVFKAPLESCTKVVDTCSKLGTIVVEESFLEMFEEILKEYTSGKEESQGKDSCYTLRTGRAGMNAIHKGFLNSYGRKTHGK